MTTAPVAPFERLEKLPEPQELPLLADWLEIRCFLAPDAHFFSEDLKSPLDEREDLGEGPVVQTVAGMVATNEMFFGRDVDEAVLSAIEGEDPDGGDADAEDAESDDEEDGAPYDPSGDDPDEVEDDREEAFTDDVLGQLLSRRYVLEDDYPFEIAADEGLVRLRGNLTDRHRLYLGLLAASCLSYVPGRQPALTKGFERLGKVVLERYLGPGARVEIFGTTAEEGNVFAGGLKERLEALSKETRLRLLDDVVDEVEESGDLGLDLVGWWPVDEKDPADGLAILWAQSGCGKDWPAKQGSAAAANWVNVFVINVEILNCMLIPYWYRDAAGGWYKRTKIAKNVVLDRRRILWLLRDDELPLAVFPADALDGLQGQAPSSA